MEIKKRKKPSRSKSKGRKNKKKLEQLVSKYPPIDYEKAKSINQITVIIKFDQARSDIHLLELKFPSNMIIKNIFDKISEKHSHSCHNLKIFMIENSKKKYLNDKMFKTFQELKIPSTENFNLYYEFEPVENPLLEAGLV